jgi:intracellular sulfur oxidation DsrE/DsrF family protein
MRVAVSATRAHVARNQQGDFMFAIRLQKRRNAASAIVLIMAAVVFAGTPHAQQTPLQRSRVVIQVSDNDPAKWTLALNNAKNIQTDLGSGSVDIEIVAFGPGIGMLKLESPVAARIDEATGSGVKVQACENTMRGQKLTKADMLNGITYVPAGVVEIIQKQQQGWAYLRP